MVEINNNMLRQPPQPVRQPPQPVGRPQPMRQAPQMPMRQAPQMPMRQAPQMPMRQAPQMPMGRPQPPALRAKRFQEAATKNPLDAMRMAGVSPKPVPPMNTQGLGTLPSNISLSPTPKLDSNFNLNRDVLRPVTKAAVASLVNNLDKETKQELEEGTKEVVDISSIGRQFIGNKFPHLDSSTYEDMSEEEIKIKAASGGGLMPLAARQEGGGVWKETPDGMREMFKRDDGNWYTKGGVDQRGLYNSKYDVDKEDPIIDKPGPTAPPLPQQLRQELPSMPIAPSPLTALPGAATRQPVTLVLDEEEDYRKRQEQKEFNDLLRRTIASRQKDDDYPASPAYPPTYSDLSPGALGGKLPLPDPIRVIPTKQQKTTEDLAMQKAMMEAAARNYITQDFAAGVGTEEGIPGSFTTIDDAAVDVYSGLKHGGGLQGLAEGGKFTGIVPGEGHGMQDNVYMPVEERGEQVATLAVSPKEYVVDAYTMAALGNGNADQGARYMDAMVENIREQAYGTNQQPNQIDGLAALRPMMERV
jgi:hypothetical protein